VRVLEQQQRVVDLTGDTLRVQLGLERGRIFVSDEPQPPDV
jgi:hypothetical protein